MQALLPQELFREGIMVLCVTAGPLFIALLAMGLFIGVFQAATQVNDPSIGFLSRLMVAFGICWFSGGWILERLAAFMTLAFQALAVR
jgi:flagellar biosynthetic protein FliQ